MPAQAQVNSKRHQGDAPAKKQDTTPKVDENAYKAALERIPEPKENTIVVWRGLRNRPRKPK